MRYLRYLATVVAIVLFFGCYEVNEEIVINADGSGTFATKMDMSQLIEMLQAMGGEEELTKEGLDRPIDTLISMNDLMKENSKASAEQKELVKDGKMRLQMDMAKKVFITDINMPFRNLNDLQKLLSGAGGSGAGMTDLFKNMFDKGAKADGDTSKEIVDRAVDPGENQMDQLSNVFDVAVKDGLISRKVNADKLAKLLANPEMAQMKELGANGIEITYTTTIKLPRAIKKVDNTLIKVSSDKKTVTLKYNLLDMFDAPEKFSYTIEY